MNSSEESAGLEQVRKELERRIQDLEATRDTLRRDVTALERRVKKLEEVCPRPSLV